MIRSKSKFSYGTRNKSSSLLTLNEIDELEKSMDWRKNYNVKPKEIGRGHFSKVFFITNENNKSFAAKVIRRRKGGIDRLDKIRKEAEIIRKLNERNIESVIHLVETHESFSEVVLICEFASGGSLFNLIQDSDTGLNQIYVKCVIHKLLLALESMHSSNIVHLDIKADNILLRAPYPSTDIAICDFGLATELKKGINHKELVGTPDYMAPEVVNYEKITFNADMWSVGVVTYFLLTKISPFMGKSKDETLINVSKVRIIFDSLFDQPDFVQAKDFILSLCKKSPNLRLSSSTAQKHKWLDNLDDFHTGQPFDITQQSSHMKRYDQNLNNHHSSVALLNGQRHQSVNFQSLDLSANYHLDIPDSPFRYSSTSCEDLSDNFELKPDENDFNAHQNICSNEHVMTKTKRDLSNVDEVADELELSRSSSQVETVIKLGGVVDDSVFKEDTVTIYVEEIKNPMEMEKSEVEEISYAEEIKDNVEMEKSQVEHHTSNAVQLYHDKFIIKPNVDLNKEMFIKSTIQNDDKKNPPKPNYPDSVDISDDDTETKEQSLPNIIHPEAMVMQDNRIEIIYTSWEKDTNENLEINTNSKPNHLQPVDVNNNIKPTDNGFIKELIASSREPCSRPEFINSEHRNPEDSSKPTESRHPETVIIESNIKSSETIESKPLNHDDHLNTLYPVPTIPNTNSKSDATPFDINGTDLEVGPVTPAIDLDEYDNISEGCDDHITKINGIKLKREISSSSSGKQSCISSTDESNDDEFEYPSLLTHWRFSELCNLL